MTTQQIGYFLKLAEELNYTKVAQAFFITQPTLSKQIVNLENELKITLFDRDHNAVRLTRAGQKFYDRMKPIFLNLMDAIRDAQSYEEDRDNLIIGIQEEQLVSNSLMLAINQLRSIYPDIKVVIHRAGSEELREGLANGKYDLVNVMSYPTAAEDERFQFVSLDNEPAYLAYSRKLLRLGDEITKQELTEVFAEHDLILPVIKEAVDNEQARRIIGIQMKGIDPDKIHVKVIQTGRAISLPVQVSSQLGVSLCNKSNLFQIDPEIRLAKVLDTEGSYNKGLLYRKEPDNPYVKVIVRLTEEEQAKFRE
ncbi:MAG: LysR family transcriptional regulator [Parasporobacterium sp.]|nr:LysR family transcriptional regulator [Parasporobacterium sp.]